METNENLVDAINKMNIEMGLGPVQEALNKMEHVNPSLSLSIEKSKIRCYVDIIVTEAYRTGTDFMTNQPAYKVKTHLDISKLSPVFLNYGKPSRTVGFIHDKGGALPSSHLHFETRGPDGVYINPFVK